MDRQPEYIGAHRRRMDVVLVAEMVVCAALAVIMCVAGFMWRSRAAAVDAMRAEGATATVEQIADETKTKTARTKSDMTRNRTPKPSSLERAKVPDVNRELARVRWTKPTGGAQPDLAKYTNLSIDVSLAAQRVYIKSNGDTIYTMIASTGMDDSTPHGSFTIGVRGDHFYNPDEQMGADYWVRIRGPYLFHSVPTNENAGQYLEDEGDKLGRPASHGCVRLSVADAKWFYDQVPYGTPVTIA